LFRCESGIGEFNLDGICQTRFSSHRLEMDFCALRPWLLLDSGIVWVYLYSRAVMLRQMNEVDQAVL